MKLCQFPMCTNPVFSHNYCTYHQRSRTDQKYIDKQAGIKKKKFTPKEPTGEGLLFSTLFTIRSHVSFISNIRIYSIDHRNCAHVLAKGQNKYPLFKLYDKNIVFLTDFEHNLYDYGTEDQRKKYAEEMAEQGITVDWQKLYDFAEVLKKEYKTIIK